MVGLFTGRSVSLAPSYAAGLKSKEAEQAAIPVEKINGPILLISGGKDQMWPSTQMSLAIMERLKAKGHAFTDQHLNYPEAGHAFYLPGLLVQTSEGAMQFGGTQTANAHAGADSWEKLLVFLQDWEKVP
jgi:dienelactone hydrolase